jgi:hypothetical protein
MADKGPPPDKESTIFGKFLVFGLILLVVALILRLFL